MIDKSLYSSILISASNKLVILMEFEKTDETEVEYWLTIDKYAQGILNAIWTIANLDITESFELRLQHRRYLMAEKALESLMSENVQKYRFILPVDPPSPGYPMPIEGILYYTDWYDKIKKIVEARYQKIICSACPFSQSMGNIVNPHILAQPGSCRFVTCGKITEKRLYRKILKYAGRAALDRFKEKQEMLKSAAD